MMLSEFVFRAERDMQLPLLPSPEQSLSSPKNSAGDQKTDSSLDGGQRDLHGNLCWFAPPGRLHRIGGPARITPHGDKEWWFEGRKHRIDGPAIERSGGTKEWWFNGQQHRIDGPAKIMANGDKFWYFEGKLHRLGAPAIEYASGGQKWFKDGASHREGGPAVDLPANGDVPASQAWWENGKQLPGPPKEAKDTTPQCKVDDAGNQYWYNADSRLHRKDGPALIILKTGHREWHLNGELHRENGPAIVYPDGTEIWYQRGDIHREGGPAQIFPSGSKIWFQRGKVHREDGPAMEYPDSKVPNKWFLFGQEVSEQGFRMRMRMSKPIHQQSWIAGRRTLETYKEVPTMTSSSEADKTASSTSTATENKTEKKKAKNWPDDSTTLIPFEEIYAPYKEVLEKGYGLRRTEVWDFEFDGYDIGKPEKKDFPPINDQLREKFLKAEKEKVSTLYPKGITLCDTVMRLLFQTGIEQGRRMAYQEHQQVKDLQKVLDRYREKMKEQRYQLALAMATLKVRDENPDADPKTLQGLITVELEKTRKARVEEIRQDLRMDPSKSLFKPRKKHKTKLSDLVGIASSLDPEIVKLSDWTAILKEAGCSMKEWKSFCQKKNFHKFIG